ncbi:DUF4145 domain-containing protein [Amycolatopsis eburnea]|nr:DUF4145 domain-containing protein [Amycolatopsis eburnea]
MASTQCGWCGVRAHMESFSRVTFSPNEEEQEFLVTRAYKCHNCSAISVASVGSPTTHPWDSNPDMFDNYVDEEGTWLPSPGFRKDFPDVPQHIGEAASEAHRCIAMGALRAAVQLARSVVEATAKEKGASSGNLLAKIDKLHEMGIIRPVIQEAAHEIRHLGNEMAHGDFIQPVMKEEAVEAVGLMDELLTEVFEAPARIEKRKLARLAKKASDGAGS